MDKRILLFLQKHKCSDCGRQTVGIRLRLNKTSVVLCNACYKSRFNIGFGMLIQDPLVKK